jgi:hypothetical protein
MSWQILPVAHHRVRLARARLAIGEDAVVVPLEGVVEQRLAQVFLQVVLAGIVGRGSVEGPVRLVEGERLGALGAGFTSLALDVDAVGHSEDGLVALHLHNALRLAVDF